MFTFVAVMVIALVVACLLLPKKTKSNNAQSQDAETPTVEEGVPIPIVFGTRLIKSPEVVWWGDTSKEAIKSKSGKKG